jgi:hypothetical protein
VSARESITSPQRIEGPGARLSIWRDAPSLEGSRTAALGAFFCEDAAAGAALIAEATRQLAAEGYGAALGPMDGDTWAAYRLVVESDGRPPFFLEPSNPPHYPAAFEEAGFSIVSRYISSVRDLDALADARPLPQGVGLRPLNPSNAEADLRAIHALSLTAFAYNAFYKPIGEERFLSSYRPVLPVLDPDLVLLAEDEAGDLLGFLFGLPNLAEGSSPSAAILKTYASLRKGLGSALAAELHARAHAKGYATVIHALMHEDNLSARHSSNLGGRVFRRYALWGRRL